MNSKEQSITLGDTVFSFLTSLSSQKGKETQQEINRFVAWYGKDRPINQITPLEVANFADQVIASGGDVAKKLEPVKSFLSYAKKEKIISTSLAPHLRIRQTSPKTPSSTRPTRTKQRQIITAEELAGMKSQLTALEEERVQVAQELRLAAADKDFRENAPLDAAKEHGAQVEIRIKEIKTALSTAILAGEEEPSEEIKVRLRSKVVLRDTTSGTECTYTLVTKNEINAAAKRISIDSPIGKALLYQCQGDIVKVIAPVGELSYQIEKIE